MSTTLPKNSKAAAEKAHHDEARIEAERIRKRARTRKIRTAQKLAARVRRRGDGSLDFRRFSRSQRFEHQWLIGSFSTLAVTGLLQRYSSLTAVAWIINGALGGIETLRTLHHLAAAIFILQAVYHSLTILATWIIHRERGSMWPRLRDFTDLMGILRHNLGKAEERPRFDRFNIEEKIEYWALIWGSIIMIITGLVQWFPTWTTWLLPGESIPISRAIHGWEAVLATLSILIWHMYHVMVKEKNNSIFSGVMSEAEMIENHPVEYERIMAARQFLETFKRKSANPAPKPRAEEEKYELVEQA